MYFQSIFSVYFILFFDALSISGLIWLDPIQRSDIYSIRLDHILSRHSKHKFSTIQVLSHRLSPNVKNANTRGIQTRLQIGLSLVSKFAYFENAGNCAHPNSYFVVIETPEKLTVPYATISLGYEIELMQ